MPDITQAQTLINQAADLYALAYQHADQYAQFEKRRVEKVQGAIQALDDKHPALLAPIKAMGEKVKLASAHALKQEWDKASHLLDEIMAQAAQASQVVVTAQSCANRLAALKVTAVPALTTHSPPDKDPVIGSAVKSLNQGLVMVGQMIKSLDYEGALAKLDELENACAGAGLKKKMKAGSLTATEMTDQCKALMAKPGGAAVLDDLVSSLSTGDAVDAVLAAMKARFKLDDAECVGTNGDALQRTKELCKIYAIMTTVPAKHTKDNPSLKKVKRQDSGSAYNSGEKAIKMGEGHPDRSSPYPVGKVTELPDVKDDCKPKASTTQPKFFDWNTLHEIGHALDDKKQFMKKNGGKSAYGGWIEHGADVLAVAQAAVSEFNLPGITAVLIAKYLDTKVAPTGLTPTSTPTQANWSVVQSWADSVCFVDGRYTCMDGAKCSQSASSGGFKLGSRVYYESYAGRWFSYEASARKEGITGYQFRAPGEWFSELYAAYKSDKLQDAHPAMSWLKELFGDKVSA